MITSEEGKEKLGYFTSQRETGNGSQATERSKVQLDNDGRSRQRHTYLSLVYLRNSDQFIGAVDMG